MDNPKAEIAISILIPTRNRSDMLQKTLTSLKNQAYVSSGVEIIVVDDASTDQTRQVLETFCGSDSMKLVTIRQPEHRGPAAARNAGIAQAGGSILLIMGDDTVPTPGLLAGHMEWHRQHPDPSQALLGKVTWPREWEVSPFMQWLEDQGRIFYFNFKGLPTGQPVPPDFFYTCNISVKMDLLKKTAGFDESFPYASHEDLEIGHRLAGCGMQLFHEPSILAHHWHELDIPYMIRRVYLMGFSAVTYWEKTGLSSSLLKRSARALLGFAGGLPISRSLLARQYHQLHGQTGHHPVGWMNMLHASYWCGWGDHQQGRSPEDQLQFLQQTSL